MARSHKIVIPSAVPAFNPRDLPGAPFKPSFGLSGQNPYFAFNPRNLLFAGRTTHLVLKKSLGSKINSMPDTTRRPEDYLIVEGDD